MKVCLLQLIKQRDIIKLKNLKKLNFYQNTRKMNNYERNGIINKNKSKNK